MCGINGIFSYAASAPAVDADELLRTRDHMHRRGPDGSGEWIDADRRIGFGHRRLAIIDLSPAGAQPMTLGGSGLTLCFNGEIYNYRVLRAELEAQGAVFVSHSDSEVILQLYAREGPAIVSRLRGMFAFAIWDARARTLFLARDPLGIKPLFYADDGGVLRFASQVKALAAGGRVGRTIEPAAITGFYLWGSIPEPWTILSGVRALPAGTTMLVTPRGVQEPERYHSVARTYLAAERADHPADDAEVAAALAESVADHLIADVPVGCFLSAGIDSGSLLGLMRDAGAGAVQTVTLGFEEFRDKRDDEVGLAAEVARYYQVPHHVRTVDAAEFRADLPRIVDAMDQPTIDGVNNWFVSKAAHELGLKVAVAGHGGDELFGGYPSFSDLPAWTRRFAATGMIGTPARHLLAGGVTRMLGINPKAAGMLEYGGRYNGAFLLRRGLFMPWELPQLLQRDVLREGLRRLGADFGVKSVFDVEPTTDFAKVATLETALYLRNQLLRDTDWASMAHSLEVRTPFVDARLLDVTARAKVAPGARPGKALLAQSPRRPLPEAIRNRRKTGFSTPIGTWLEGAMAGERMPAAARGAKMPWARRWACHVAAAQGFWNLEELLPRAASVGGAMALTSW